MLTELYDEMMENDISLISYNMSKSQSNAVTMRIADSYAVFVDYGKIKSYSDELSTIAHELGHIKTGTTHAIYSPYELVSRHEYRATKWAVLRLIPFERLICAFENGYADIWELAEYFDVPEPFVSKALDVYVRQGKLRG